ncbi:MAG: HAD family phosphatase, partial [Acidimicrobiia bacterium]|nr:HAD family phosphatase [Acidimicrobiia bacterium]
METSDRALPALMTPITTMIFDLDGTLVQTEKLKAQSYALAAVELCTAALPIDDVIAAFSEVVGLPRREVAIHLVDKFGLQQRALAVAPSFGVDTAWQAFVQVRLRHYNEMLADPDVIRKHRWDHNIELLEYANRMSCKTGLATMSHCAEASRVLEILELRNRFDFIATRDDVSNGKPDPEIYLLVAAELQADPAQCLVIEDSPTGVAAAIAAGMRCVAVATPFTKDALHSSGLLDERWIVDDPADQTRV